MLGDVGGLYDALIKIVSLVLVAISLVNHSGSQNYIVEQIFKTDKTSTKFPTQTLQDKIAKIKRRKPLKFSGLLCFRKKDRMRMYESAQRSYEQELDIVHFVKLQKITQSLLKMLYTDFERFLLANNTCFVRCKGHDVTDEVQSDKSMQL